MVLAKTPGQVLFDLLLLIEAAIQDLAQLKETQVLFGSFLHEVYLCSFEK